MGILKVNGNIEATGTIKASSFLGNATSATALTISAGSSTQPVYFSGGKPIACTHTLSKSVPSDAVFTDTNTKVTQTSVTAEHYTNWRPLVIGYSNGDIEGFTPSTVTDTTITASTISCQPSSGTIRATTFKGALSGNADSATKLSYSSRLTSDSAIDSFHAANTFQITTWNNTSSPGVSNGIILDMGWVSTNYGVQIAIDDDPTYFIALRQKGSDGWKAWKKIPMEDGTNASGTWNINISGSSASCLGNYTYSGGQQNPNYFGTNRVGFLMMNTTVNGNAEYKDWIIMDCYGGSDVGGGVAFGVNRQRLGAYIMRSAATRTSWAESAELLHTSNYTSYCAPASHSHPYASLGSPNNLMHSGNEFTFVPDGYSDSVWFNYRTANWNTNGNISLYIFGNGKTGRAPIEYLYDITHNYGDYDPNSTSPPGTGVKGAIFYRII